MPSKNIVMMVKGSGGNWGRWQIGLRPDGGDGFTGVDLSPHAASCTHSPGAAPYMSTTPQESRPRKKKEVLGDAELPGGRSEQSGA